MIDRAIVVGAGLAGLCAAAAMAPHAGQVVVVERDVLANADVRRGVPQGRQLHNLLGRAQLHLDQLFPGFLDELDAAGCGRGRVSSETWVHELGIQMPQRDLGFTLRCAARPVIALVARTLLARRANVRIVDDTRVQSLTHDGIAVTGVRLLGSTSGPMNADLVVDASGPAAMAARLCEQLGRPVPTIVEQSDQWYTSVQVELTHAGSSQFWMSFPAGAQTAGALVSPAGTGTSYVSVSGRGQDRVPDTWAQMMEHVTRLGHTELTELLHAAQPIEQPSTFHRVVARWHRFDSADAPIVGLLPIGDAMATLNPLFGQGMSVAAWQASVLSDVINATLGRGQGLADCTTDYLHRSAEPVTAAWNLGRIVAEALVSDDGMDLTDALAAEIRDDADLHRRYVRIWHLLESPNVLARPEMLRLLQHGAKQAGEC